MIIVIVKALHPRDNTDILYVSRKVEGRGLASLKDSLDALVQRLEENIKKSKEMPISTASNSNDNTRTNRKKYKN